MALLTPEPSSTYVTFVIPFSGACLMAKPASVKLPRMITTSTRLRAKEMSCAV